MQRSDTPSITNQPEPETTLPQDRLQVKPGLASLLFNRYRGGIWRSRLCGTVFTIGGIFLITVAATFWYLSQTGASVMAYTLLAIAGITGLILLSRLMLQVQRNLLQPLTTLRDWAQSMRKGNLAARLPLIGSKDFDELVKDSTT